MDEINSDRVKRQYTIDRGTATGLLVFFMVMITLNLVATTYSMWMLFGSEIVCSPPPGFKLEQESGGIQ